MEVERTARVIKAFRHGRNESRANAVAEAIRAGGGKAAVALGDLATDARADAVAVAALSGGPLDMLVNNADQRAQAGAGSQEARPHLRPNAVELPGRLVPLGGDDAVGAHVLADVVMSALALALGIG
jgi:hypothetical protein